MRRVLLTIAATVALILAAFAGAVLLAESEWAPAAVSPPAAAGLWLLAQKRD